LAPDRSEIRLLGSFGMGGLAQCTLHAGATSSPVRHRSVHEIWFVVDGVGELWRSTGGADGNVTPLWPGIGLEISKGTAFQFRTTGTEPLRIVILTMPQWPGPSEAVPVKNGRWTFPGVR
jgi:mannose-6-phosphate isomerase-like protein (cupin superfamily)